MMTRLTRGCCHSGPVDHGPRVRAHLPGGAHGLAPRRLPQCRVSGDDAADDNDEEEEDDDDDDIISLNIGIMTFCRASAGRSPRPCTPASASMSCEG
jgi:hypothetical protein